MRRRRAELEERTEEEERLDREWREAEAADVPRWKKLSNGSSGEEFGCDKVDPESNVIGVSRQLSLEEVDRRIKLAKQAYKNVKQRQLEAEV